MSQSTNGVVQLESAPSSPFRISFVAIGIAAIAAAAGWIYAEAPESPVAMVAAVAGVVGMIVAGYAISRRPKNPAVIFMAAVTSFLAAIATNPTWDSIRLMQTVMATIALIVTFVVLLPPTGQKVVVSLVVLYHFAGITSAITSPDPTPWLTSQLWARVFRPHLEFNYVNNAYHFYSPQPGPAQILWFCITGEDDQSTWYKMPRRSEMLDPLGIEYFRRLSLTERARQPVYGLQPDTLQARRALAHDFPLQPRVSELLQYQPPNEHARHIFSGYAKHVANSIGTGRKDADGRPIPVKRVKVYLVQHEMLTQSDFKKSADPYAPETYRPIFEGEFDSQGKLLNPFDPLLYWAIPIFKDDNGNLKNYVIMHATLSGDCDPFNPEHEWRPAH